MKKFYGLAAAASLLVSTAAAQDDMVKLKLQKEMEAMLVQAKGMAAGARIRNRVVTGAPYSGQEVSDTTQTLADGTRIHNETKTMVYRDSEGRIRRESGDTITIFDPVANVNYVLDTKTMSGTKNPAIGFAFHAGGGAGFGSGGGGGVGVGHETSAFAAGMAAGAGSHATVSVKDGMITLTKDGKTTTFPMPASGEWVSDDGTLRASSHQMGTGTGNFVFVNSGSVNGVVTVNKDGKTTTRPLTPEELDSAKMKFKIESDMAGNVGGGVMVRRPADMKEEPLGEQMIEGIKARGTRQTSTIEAGKIGNDRALSTVSESWYSEELQTEISSKRTDPRTGESTFRLTGISRGEPPAFLFQPPSGYNVTERK